MISANEGSGMVDVKALMAAARAHEAQSAQAHTAQPLLAAPRPLAALPVVKAAPRSNRALFAMATATLVLAIATTAFALTIPRGQIRGRIESKPLAARQPIVDTATDRGTVSDTVTATDTDTATVTDTDTDTVTATAPTPRRPRRPRITPPTTEPTTPTRRPPPAPTGPRTLEELMNGALR